MGHFQDDAKGDTILAWSHSGCSDQVGSLPCGHEVATWHALPCGHAWRLLELWTLGNQTYGRQLRSRIASLRAQMVKQRREIDALTKELITEELRCASQASEEGEEKQILNRLFRSLGVLVHTAWKNGDPVSFVYNQTGTAIRVAGETAASGELIRDVLPNAPTLLSYAPGLYAHASRLDRHLPQILSDYGSVSPKKHQLEFFLEKTGYSLAQANALTTAMNTLCMAWAVFAGWVADVQLGDLQHWRLVGNYGCGTFADELSALLVRLAGLGAHGNGRYQIQHLKLWRRISEQGESFGREMKAIQLFIYQFPHERTTDQYDVSDPEQVAAQEQFFQWQLVESGFFGACRVAKVENRPLNRFYMAINVGSAFAYSFLTTLGTNGGPGIPKEYGYFAAYLIASICMLCAVVSFFSVRGRYRTSPLQRTSAMADVCKRIAVELRQCKREAILATLGASLAVLAIAFSVASALLQNEVTHGHVFIFSVVSFALASSGALLIILSCENPEWVSNDTLAGVSLSADDTRNFLKLVPVIITAQLAFGALYNCMQYSFQQQACQMDVRIPGSGDAQFAGSFFMIGDCLGIAIATPIAVGWFNPLLESRLGRYFSHEGKFLFGMFVGGLSVILAAYLELMRRAVPVSDRISNCAPEGVHMSDLSAVWMFLPFLLCGIGEIYTNPVIMHLAYSSSSAATRTLAVVATLLVQALGTAIFGVQVTALSQFMPNDLNNGHIEYGYYMSLGIALFFYVAFVRAMRIFRPV
ncbi:unnamed protein product [Durusdinium trenchii]|uniref:Uncharacterized protein n=1 Tax=Durusdinium trenchii TaxID=1381693 RepID=A0ABP0RA51_9DINO